MRALRVKFGKRLYELRKREGLTQEQLASKANISVDFLSLMERGKNSPSFETLEKLSKALDIPIKDFFSFDE